MMTFEQENNQILQSVLDNVFFKTFKKPWEQLNHGEKNFGIEFYITPECNQNCSYCYLQAHGHDLYPKQLRDKTKIKENLNIFLNYLLENKMNPYNIDLFTGDIWDTEFGMEILEIIFQALQRGLRVRKIMIPSNFSFILSDKYSTRIERYQSEYAKYDVALKFSCSNDGYYIDKMTRPFFEDGKTQLKGTEEYYDKLFKFCQRTKYAFHPMVSAHGIEYWKENFKWWMESLKKYEFDEYGYIMFLETRNDDWTDDKILHYLKYLDYSMEYYYKDLCNNDINQFLAIVTGSNKNNKFNHYIPFRIASNRTNLGCAINKMLCVRLGDMAIAPCHRTSYDEFMIGKFIVKDDKIVDVEAKNIQMMNQIWFSSYHGMAKCNQCPLSEYCLKGCLGSQFESTGDLLYPCNTVCELFWARIIFMYYRFNNEICKRDPKVATFCEAIDQEKDREEFKKWINIIQNNF